MPFKPYLIAALCVLALSFAACKSKKKSGGDTKPAEEDLKVELVGVVPDVSNPAQGTSHPFKVKLNSKVPANGVKITVEAKVIFSDAQVPQNAPFVSTVALTDVTLINLPSMKECLVKVTVTSETKPANTKVFTFNIYNKI